MDGGGAGKIEYRDIFVTVIAVLGIGVVLLVVGIFFLSNLISKSVVNGFNYASGRIISFVSDVAQDGIDSVASCTQSILYQMQSMYSSLLLPASTKVSAAAQQGIFFMLSMADIAVYTYNDVTRAGISLMVALYPALIVSTDMVSDTLALLGQIGTSVTLLINAMSRMIDVFGPAILDLIPLYMKSAAGANSPITLAYSALCMGIAQMINGQMLALGQFEVYITKFFADPSQWNFINFYGATSLIKKNVIAITNFFVQLPNLASEMLARLLAFIQSFQYLVSFPEYSFYAGSFVDILQNYLCNTFPNPDLAIAIFNFLTSEGWSVNSALDVISCYINSLSFWDQVAFLESFLSLQEVADWLGVPLCVIYPPACLPPFPPFDEWF